MKKTLLSIILSYFILSNSDVAAQNDQVLKETNSLKLFELADQWRNEKIQSLESGQNILVEQQRETRIVEANGTISQYQGLSNDGRLLFYITDNLDAARTVSTDKVWPGGGLGYTLTGSGMEVGEWDGGSVRTTHQELTGRAFQLDSTSTFEDHPTHVAGTMIAAGVVSTAKGMAYAAELLAYDWNFDNSEMAAAAANGMLISNHSYGSITGWRYNSSTTNWEWWGDTTLSGSQDYKFGQYNSQAQAWDQIARNAPYYLIVKSAGNDRGQVATGSHYLPLHSAWSTTSRPADGGTSGYDCISTYSGAKNILTIGAVNAIPAGYSGPGSVVMSSFSGWGPTDDGRIKPDLVANGVGVYSSLATSNSAYASWNGTSMAAPNAAGSLVLVQQKYFNENAAYMKAATLKALAIHTADEAGSGAGPDYSFGWGLLNTASAVQHIADTTGTKAIVETSISNSNTYTFNINVNGFFPIKTTICWTDLAGTPSSTLLNSTTPMLVNDLDIRIIRVSDSTIYYPYILNPASPSAAATTGDNFRDNVEQIFISSPSSGSYTVIVSHKGSLAGGSQDFSLIIDGGIPPAQPLNCVSFVTPPSAQNFDGLTNCSSTAGASCVLPTSVGWYNDTNDDIDWTVDNGGTPSGSTGPSVDFTAGNSTGKYLYTESSTSGTGFPGKQAVLYSPCINLDTITNAELYFAYHMYGSTMGSMKVEVFNGFGWTQLWTESGDKGDVWNIAIVDLSLFDGDTIQLRIVGTTGSGFYSDMAIDGLEIREALSCPESNGSNVSSVTDSTATISWNSTASFWKVRLEIKNGPVHLPNTMINFNPVLISGLAPNTTYEFYIQDSCSNGDTSTWFGPIEFTTSGPSLNPTICGLNAAIPDDNCPNLVYFPVQVSTFGTQLGTDVILSEVKIIIEHTWDADLQFWISSPAGDTILLSAGNGGSGDNYGNPNDLSCSQTTTFTMSASNSITTGTAPFIGNYLPQDSISNLHTGGDPNGIWKFIVCDDAASDIGSLEYFELVFDSIVCNPPQVSVLNNGSDDVCIGDTRTLSSSIIGISYQWYKNGSPVSGATSSSLVINDGGLYNVWVDSTATCGDSAVTGRNIVIRALPVVSINNTGLSTFCFGGNTTLLANSGASGYQWYKDGNPIIGSNSVSNIANSTGKYNVILTSSFGCTDSASNGVNIIVDSLPVVNLMASSSTTFCQNDSVTLFTLTPGISYSWYRNGSLLTGPASSAYSASTAGNYNVIVSDVNNCSDSSSSGVQVVVHPLPIVNIVSSGSTTFCDEDSVALSTSGGVSYQWYNSGNLIGGAISQSLNVKSTGNYNVIVTNNNTCSDSAALFTAVTVNPLPVGTISFSSQEICAGDTSFLTVNPTFSSYNWIRNGNPTGWTSSNTYPATLSGLYTVLIEDGLSCEDTAQNNVQIVVNDLPVVTLDPLDDVCNIAPTFALSGGNPAGGIYSGTGVTSGQFDPGIAGPGTHDILYTYTDSKSCVDSAGQQILVKNCTGIDENENTGKVSFYPNPTNGTLFVEFDEIWDGEILLQLFNTEGSLVFNKRIENISHTPKVTIQLNEFSSGIYFLHLIKGQEKWIQKVIFEKNF